MRIHTALAALLLTVLAIQAPALAESSAAARLSLKVVNQANAVLPGASVTVFTLDGNPAMTATTDASGVAVFTSLPAGLTEVYAKVDGFSPFIEKTTLRPGENTQTATLSPTDVESGS